LSCVFDVQNLVFSSARQPLKFFDYKIILKSQCKNFIKIEQEMTLE